MKTKFSNDDDNPLRSLVLYMQTERDIEKLAMLQVWNLLSREHFKFESNNFSAHEVKVKIRFQNKMSLPASLRLADAFENKEAIEESTTSYDNNNFHQLKKILSSSNDEKS